MKGNGQTGLVCCSAIDDYENNLIKKHELTRPEKEQDRINHMKTTGAQTGNVFLAYKHVSAIDEVIENWKRERSPVYDFIADDKIQHTIWIVNDEKIIQKSEADKLDPNTITEINVLKDKQATDKYGEKGKNGVVEIKTKKG